MIQKHKIKLLKKEKKKFKNKKETKKKSSRKKVPFTPNYLSEKKLT